MTKYERYTSKDGATLTMSQWGGSPAELELYRKLAELEDKIDNGTLTELPCKVGDVLYYVNKYETTPRIEENKVHTIEIYECMDGLTIRIWTQNGTFYADKMPNVFTDEEYATLERIHGELLAIELRLMKSMQEKNENENRD